MTSSPRPTGAPLVELRVWEVPRVGLALARMATGRRRLRHVPGLRFAKLLGTGSGQTFTLRDADPHRWALLTVWDPRGAADDSPEAAADRFATTRAVGSWEAAARETLRVRMSPVAARGLWSGVEPFGEVTATGPHRGPVAALTRARLRPTRAVGFWRAVPPVSADLAGSPGLRLSLGIGEAPLGLQGTFSLWDSTAALVDFAYRRSPHRAVVDRTPLADWYAEELFARLAVHEVAGTYRGRTP